MRSWPDENRRCDHRAAGTMGGHVTHHHGGVERLAFGLGPMTRRECGWLYRRLDALRALAIEGRHKFDHIGGSLETCSHPVAERCARLR